MYKISFYDTVFSMNTFTIPKSLIKNDDLIVLPRREYEKLLRIKNNDHITIKRSTSFKIKKGQEKVYDDLDKDLTKEVREYKAAKFTGPFDSVKDLMKSLNL